MGLRRQKPYKIVTLDHRHAGRLNFKYMIDCRGNDRDEIMFKFRNWFWANYGPSSEFRSWMIIAGRNLIFQAKNLPVAQEISEVWSWDTEFKRSRIYIRDDETLSNFILHHY